MTLIEKIENKNTEIQSVRFNNKDTLAIKVNIPKKLEELIRLIKSIESGNREFKYWVKDNSISLLEESIRQCKKCYNPSRINSVSILFLKTTIDKCKELVVEAVKNLYSTAEFFEVNISGHLEKEISVQ